MRLAMVIPISLMMGTTVCAQGDRMVDRRVLHPFDYKGVTLDGGAMRRQIDEVREYYLRIPNDDLLKGFRLRAGKPAPGADLGGLYTADVFHVFGQVLSGLARMYVATADPECKAKLDALIHGWAECIEPDGYFYYTRKPNVFHYTYDKMVGGLVDAYLYASNGEGLPALSRITDWAIKHLDRTRPYGADGAEWYTLSENLYRAWAATGDSKYREFAKVWEYTAYWDLYAADRDIHGPRPGGAPWGGYHAYSHVNTLGGAGRAYLATGQQHYLDTLIHAYDYLKSRVCFATGGFGPDETISPPEDRRNRLASSHNTFETQCGTWAAFKMCKYLISFTGDARFGDWIERLIVNGIGATIPMTADGRVFYYSDYNPGGGRKVNIDTGWTCCTGTRPMAVADFADLVYFHGPNTLNVSLYTPSTVHWKTSGSEVEVHQRTRFPEEDRAEFDVTARKPVAFILAFRSPGWLAAPMEVKVNGQSVDAKADSRHWVSIRRTWRSGDRVEIRLPMGLKSERLDSDRPYPFAVLDGPVVLAFRAPGPLKASALDQDQLTASLIPSVGEPLTYHLVSDPAILARPFSAFKESELYFLYLDPAARLHLPAGAAQIKGNWQGGPGFRFTNAVGATATVSFEGTGIRWLGGKFDDAGRAEVSVDGKLVGIVDQYGPGRNLPFEWHVDGLANGRHTVKLTLTAEKTAESKDRYINFAGFEVIPHPPTPSPRTTGEGE